MNFYLRVPAFEVLYLNITKVNLQNNVTINSITAFIATAKTHKTVSVVNTKQYNLLISVDI